MNKKEKDGTVIGNKKYMEGTITVAVSTTTMHPLYKKAIKKVSKLLMEWPPKTLIEVGTRIAFVQCKPLSKRKNWIITGIRGLNQ